MMKGYHYRWCKLKLVPHCEQLFFETIKKIGKFKYREVTTKAVNRTYGCRQCLQRLYILNLSIKRWKKLKDQVIEENFKWLDKKNAMVDMIIETPLKSDDGKELLGTKRETINRKTTKIEIELGLLVAKERNEKNIKQVLIVENQLDALNPKPMMTVSMKKLKTSLQNMSIFEKYEKLVREQKQLREQINLDNKFIDNREDLLGRAPE